MANATDSGAHRVHGTDPQYLIEKIIRQRIYDSPYWKEKCFGLDAATLVDQAVQLTHAGGIYSDHNIPTPFLCLTLKLLQLSPPTPIVVELLQQPTYKYIRLLAALYIRLTGRAEEVYGLLDALLSDWRKVRRRREDGTWELLHVDELIDEMLVKERCCSVTLPRLAKRDQLVAAGRLEERKSAVVDMMEEEAEEEKASKAKEAGREEKETAASSAEERKESEVSASKQATVQQDNEHAGAVVERDTARQRSREEESDRHRGEDRRDGRSEGRERERESDRDRREDRSRERRRDDRDDAEDRHRRHSSSRHHRRHGYSPSRSRSPDRRDRHSRRRERDEDRERRNRDDRHHRRKRSTSSSRSRSYSPHRRSRRRSKS